MVERAILKSSPVVFLCAFDDFCFNTCGRALNPYSNRQIFSSSRDGYFASLLNGMSRRLRTTGVMKRENE